MVEEHQMRRKDNPSSGPDPQGLPAEEQEEAIRLPVPDRRPYQGGPKRDAPLQTGNRSLRQADPSVTLLQQTPQEVVVEELPEEVDPEMGWESTEGRSRSLPVGYLYLGAATLMSLSIWAVALLLGGEDMVVTEIKDLSSRLDQEAIELQEAEHLLELIEEVIGAYLAADTIEEKSRYVRHPDRVRPLMEQYYANTPLVPVKYQRVENLLPFGLEQQSFMVLRVRVGEGDGRIINVVMEQTGDDRVRFDWESEVAYQPISLEDYIAEKPAGSFDFRMYVEKDHFYAFEFSEVDRYLCVMLTERDSDAFLFGYVERGGQAHRDIAGILDESLVGKEPIFVRVRFLPGTRSIRSVLVEEVIAPRWTHARDPGA